ncbi:MAG TPA: transglutaminase family protein [Methanoregula sp.]|nr:transglutaminase family protein [Methanoregula sp.]
MDSVYLSPTFFIDSDEAAVKEKSRELTAVAREAREKAIHLFYFVRDRIRYNVFAARDTETHFKASRVLAAGEGYCVQKAVLLVALTRAAGIPARLRFAAIRGHLTPPDLVEKRGSNVFAFHGLADLYINERWVKATPTYDMEYCRKMRIEPVEFDGRNDAMLPPYDLNGRRNVEYLEDKGPYDDLPLEEIRNASVSRKYVRAGTE